MKSCVGGVRTLIDSEPGLSVIGEASSVTEALDVIAEANPRVALLDLHLPDGTGVELCRALRERHPEIACLILTSYEDDEAKAEAAEAGAAGYLLKQIRGGDIVTAIQAAAAGRSLLDAAGASRAPISHHESTAMPTSTPDWNRCHLRNAEFSTTLHSVRRIGKSPRNSISPRRP